MVIETHMTDSDGIREIRAKQCARSETIEKAIDAMARQRPGSKHNQMLANKLYIALNLREAYEAEIKYNNRHI